MYVYTAGAVTPVPSGWFTVTFTGPTAAPDGVVTVICVLVTTTTLVAGLDPNETVAPDWKFLPAIVTACPPPRGPALGLTVAMDGWITSSPVAVPQLPAFDALAWYSVVSHT